MSIKPREARAKLFTEWLAKDANFMQDIKHKGNFLDQINQQIQLALPANLQNEFKLANIQATTLILYTTKASNLISFRFCQQDVLTKIKQSSPWVTAIEVKVRPKQLLVTKPKFRAATLSSTSQQNLANLAKNTSNPKLKQALLNLAHKKNG